MVNSKAENAVGIRAYITGLKPDVLRAVLIKVQALALLKLADLANHM